MMLGLHHRPNHTRIGYSGFTLVEVLITCALLGGTLVSFYTGIASGFLILNVTRENLRANQVVLEKMETIRLYSWDQVNSNGFIPDTFTASFYPAVPGSTNASPGITYYGSITITNTPIDAPYSASLRLVRVSLLWTNRTIAHAIEAETFVSEYGMQNYVY